MVKHKFGQRQKKLALRNLIRAKNKDIVNDTDKSMGAEDTDKTDVI